MKSRTYKKLGILLPALMLGACAVEPTMTERNFGDSVRQMVQAQINDPATVSSPSEATIERTDGQLLEGVLENYRTTTGDSGSVGDEITINVGGGQ
jgi:type IV pilus biogenesis protein CpaD/CtpE